MLFLHSCVPTGLEGLEDAVALVALDVRPLQPRVAVRARGRQREHGVPQHLAVAVWRQLARRVAPALPCLALHHTDRPVIEESQTHFSDLQDFSHDHQNFTRFQNKSAHYPPQFSGKSQQNCSHERLFAILTRERRPAGAAWPRRPAQSILKACRSRVVNANNRL